MPRPVTVTLRTAPTAKKTFDANFLVDTGPEQPMSMEVSMGRQRRTRVMWLVVGSLVVGGTPACGPKQEQPGEAERARSGSNVAGPKTVKIDPMVIRAIEALAAEDPTIALRVYSMAAESYQAKNQPDRALAIYEAAANAFPQQEDALNKLLGFYQQQGQHEQLIKVAEQLAKLRPETSYYSQLIANAHFLKGDTAAGLAAWQALIEAHPDDPALQVQFALTLQGQGRHDEALQHFETAAQLTPEDVGLQQQLGQAYMAAQQWDQARRLYEPLFATSQEPWVQRDAGRQLLVIAMQQKTLDVLLADAEATLTSEPSNLSLHWQLIEGYAMSGTPDEMEAALERAVKRFSDDQELRWRLIQAYQGQAKWDQAVGVLQELAAKRPSDMIVTSHLAQADAAAGRPQEAVAVLEQAAKADPANPNYVEQMAELYVRANRFEEAMTRYEALLANASEEWRKAQYASRIEQLRQQAQQVQASQPSPPAVVPAAPTPQTGPPAAAVTQEQPAKKKRRR